MENQKKSRANSIMMDDLSAIYPTESPIVAMEDYISPYQMIKKPK